MRKLKKGSKVGAWTLVKRLGRGGNAEVWQATSGNQEEFALKVLIAVDGRSEPYKRFTQEIRALEGLKGHGGVLPLLNFSLPDAPSDKNRAWLSMPVAIPIKRALGGEPDLEECVRAVGRIARTLSDLGERGISHRDIKPGNLYRYDGEYLVGDFGLVDWPDKESLTKPGRGLGPQFFIAPEMLQDPRNADGRVISHVHDPPRGEFFSRDDPEGGAKFSRHDPPLR